MKELSRYLRYYKKEVIIGPIFKLLEAIFELLVPLIMASIIDEGIKRGDKTFILQRGALMILLGFMGLIFALICQYCAARASQGIGTRMRDDLFGHINSLSHGELDQLGTNKLITIITNDVNQMQLAVAMLIRLVVRAPFLIIGAIVMAMILDLKLSLIFLIVAPLVAAVLYVVMNRSVPFYKRRQKTLDKVSLITRENLSGARVVRAFSKQDSENQRFMEANEEVSEVAIRVGKISAILNPATYTILNVAILAILWFGGQRVDLGVFSQGEVIAFTNYMTQISLALVVVANLVVIFTKAAASAARINQVFDMKSSIKDIEISQQSKNIKETNDMASSHIVFDHVSFAYPDSEEYALEDIHLHIEKGETIGIIGGTGSGKSTLVQLLPRFYDASKGEIYYKGRNIKKIAIEELRGYYGIVPQRPVLFSGTIIDNLKMSKEDATMEDIERAIEISQSKEFVETLKDKYQTKISQGGRNLSGGQRQRLTIARALVRNPEVLILDDSSSALDYATDAKLRLAIQKQCKDMTTIIISQRARSIQHADKIIVLDDGKVVGIGKHDDLYENCQVYRDICLSQRS